MLSPLHSVTALQPPSGSEVFSRARVDYFCTSVSFRNPPFGGPWEVAVQRLGLLLGRVVSA